MRKIPATAAFLLLLQGGHDTITAKDSLVSAPKNLKSLYMACITSRKNTRYYGEGEAFNSPRPIQSHQEFALLALVFHTNAGHLKMPSLDAKESRKAGKLDD